MAVPTAAAIRRLHPQAEIVWAIEDRCSALIDTESLVNQVFEVPRQRWKKGGAGAWFATVRHYLKLRAFSFDYGLDLQGHGKTALCLRLSNAQRRLSVPSSDSFSRLLNPQAACTKSLHMVESNLRTASELLDTDDQVQFIMPCVTQEVATIKSMIGSTPLVTIAVGTGDLSAKTVMPDFWARIARLLLAERFQVAFLGGAGDESPNLPEAIDWVGRFTWKETIAAIKSSSLHLAGDTGCGHIAAACRVPVVSLFRNSDPARFRPYSERAMVLQEPFSVQGVMNTCMSMVSHLPPSGGKESA